VGQKDGGVKRAGAAPSKQKIFDQSSWSTYSLIARFEGEKRDQLNVQNDLL